MSAPTASINGNLVEDNSNATGDDVYLSVGNSSTFQYNTVITNTAGAGSVTSSPTTIDAYGPIDLEYNNIVNPGNTYELADGSGLGTTLDAMNVWWNTLLPTDIAGRIYDGNTQPDLGTVSYQPALAGWEDAAPSPQ